MFLNELNENEATAFINVVSEFANVDNTFAKEEKEVLEGYLKDLKLTKDIIGKLNFDKSLQTLNESKDRIKKIVYFELIGLALVDGEYGDKEVEFLDNIAKQFGISRTKRIAFANYFYNFTDVYKFSVVESENKIELLREQAEAILD
ncbi:hypothetical protein [Clostridium gasigenes]|uniref:Tellurite resistance protein TerB n=1 Tax=Clostridium gasigenes TaxID=94869 RepID=A0A1H0QE16_9CLOT|nr:hypothetical protein [Clostridium gasigenes]MBB6623399.1 hypothetical protein [Clostridium gasigenes]MBU3087977.1 hypothetical protein [Clostridium gasigenes]MBU3133655.1 hypothetical protein [Clostridium gasigenes]SDP15577.1 hypothetical protein SAMN04488529_102321 [Clostridium gasigenes]